jgi:hypothetical protein
MNGMPIRPGEPAGPFAGAQAPGGAFAGAQPPGGAFAGAQPPGGAFAGAQAPGPSEPSPLWAASPTPGCRICGSVPAAPVTFRAHRGMVVLMQFRSLPGPFCRDCGLWSFRRMTADTLLQGWWGLASFFITPIVLLINLCLRHRVAGLPAPGPSRYGPSHPSPGPGKPLLAQPQAIAGLVIIAVLVLTVTLR